MGRLPKIGLDYSNWPVNILDGNKMIDKLLEAQSCAGFIIYFYLWQKASGFEGYFYRWSYDDAPTTARRLGCGIKSETVKATVGACFQIGLFDKRLFEENAILTSRELQLQFRDATKKRRKRCVIADYWLLDESESEGLEMCDVNGVLLPRNSIFSPQTPICSPQMQQSKVKESKVKESKKAGGGESAPSDEGFGFGPELETVLLRWLAYKKEKGQPCGEIALETLLSRTRKNVDIYGEETVVELIQDCMSSNWDGIIWDLLKGSQKKETAGKSDSSWMKEYIQQSGNGESHN